MRYKTFNVGPMVVTTPPISTPAETNGLRYININLRLRPS
jgi:hypothetical protein